MKNKLKYLTLILVVTLSSCLLSDDSLTEKFDDGPNFTSFSSLSQNLSAVADGQEYIYPINLELQGPTAHEMDDDITVNVSVDASSTAIEGIHYRLDSKSTIISKSNNYIGAIPITLITEGIEAPSSVELILSITDSSGNSNVISNSKMTTLSIIYQCFADLSGTYTVTNDGCNMTPFETTITRNPSGSWFIAIGDGGFLGYGCTGNPGLNNWANITELCGEILPSNDLEFAPCCSIGNITGGSWDEVTGILTLNHTQEFTGNWPGSWTSTYIKQ